MRTRRLRSLLVVLSGIVLCGVVALPSTAQMTPGLDDYDPLPLDLVMKSASVMNDSGEAADMLLDANEEGDALLEYGNWYGPGWWGGERDTPLAGPKPPVDALDAVAMRHDFAYSIAEKWGKIYGPREEQRLKAMADAIAVRDAEALPENPLDWDPPAADPQRAARYRDRISFGFDYLSTGRDVGSRAYNALDWVTSPIENLYSSRSENQITEGMLESQVDTLVKDWYETHPALPTFRLEIVRSQSVVAEGGSVSLRVVARPLSDEHPWKDSYAMPITLTVDGGPGTLSRSAAALNESVELRAGSRWFGLSSEGYKISVTARSSGKTKGATFVPTTAQFLIGRTTRVTLNVEPNRVAVTEKGGCVDVALGASLADADHDPIAGQAIAFLQDGVVVYTGVTDEQGVCEGSVPLCAWDLGGEDFKRITFTARFGGTPSGDPIYAGASDTASVALEGEPVTATIGGRVYDYVHTTAIAGASVTLSGSGVPTARTTTDAAGAFSFQVSLPADPAKREETKLELVAAKDGYQEDAGTTGSGTETSYLIHLFPKDAVFIGVVTDAADGAPLAGGTATFSEPSSDVKTTSVVGEFSMEGLYIGDRVTVTVSVEGYQPYTKSGTITAETAQVLFPLKVGQASVSGRVTDGKTGQPVAGASITVATDTGPLVGTTGEDGRYVFTGLKVGTTATVTVTAEHYDATSQTVVIDDVAMTTDFRLGFVGYGLTIWASPADPGPGQGVTVTALVDPREAGVPIRLVIVGTDGYSNSITTVTDATGRATLHIPGANAGVVDRVTVTLLDQAESKRLNYTF